VKVQVIELVGLTLIRVMLNMIIQCVYAGPSFRKEGTVITGRYQGLQQQQQQQDTVIFAGIFAKD